MSRGANTGKGSWCVMKQPEAPFAKCRLFFLFFFFNFWKSTAPGGKCDTFVFKLFLAVLRGPPLGVKGMLQPPPFFCVILYSSLSLGLSPIFPLSSDPSSSLTFPFWSLYHPQRCCSVTTTFNVTTNPIIAVTLRPGRTVQGSGVNVIKRKEKKSLP